MARKKLTAAIDVGSHEILLRIAELPHQGKPKEIESVRRTLAIGTDTYNCGNISQELTDACSEVMAGFADKLSEYRIQECRAVATSAFREAGNRLFVLDQINRSSGLQIEVLTNSEERFYHLLAASELIEDFEKMIEHGTLILDIGAGSIQATVFDKGQFVFTQNMLLGSLRVREILADLERQAADFSGLMSEYVSGDLENYRMLEPKGTTYRYMIVLGGENSYLKMLAGLDPEDCQQLTLSEFNNLYQLLLNNRQLENLEAKTVPADHIPLLLPAAMIIHKFANFTGVNNIYMPIANLCDGLIYESAAQKGSYELRHNQEADTISACRHLARRFKTDRSHGQIVENISIDLFRQTIKLHRLPKRCQLLLRCAAILHDIGKYISMSRHAYRSYHIIMASEIIGINHEEQTIIALLARYHSGSIDLSDPLLTELNPQLRLKVCKMIALFRIANSLDTGHRQKIKNLEVQLEEDSLVLIIEADSDITLEKWNMNKSSDFFRNIYGLDTRIKLRRRRSL